jgi:hypothetical protein
MAYATLRYQQALFSGKKFSSLVRLKCKVYMAYATLRYQQALFSGKKFSSLVRLKCKVFKFLNSKSLPLLTRKIPKTLCL